MGFPTAYAGPPLTGSGGLVLLVGFRGEKRLANGSLGRRKIPAFPGGRRARTARTKHGRGPWPRPCFGFAGLGGPRAPQTRKTPPPPGAPQRRPATPTPARFRRPYSGGPAAPRKAPAFQRGAAAFGGSGAARRAAPLPQTKERGPGLKAPGPALSLSRNPAMHQAYAGFGSCSGQRRRI